MERHWKSVHVGNVFPVTNVLSFLLQNDKMERHRKIVHVGNVFPVTNVLSF